MAFDYFTGAWISNAATVRPTPSGAMYPVDDVVPCVHRIGIGRQQLNSKGIFVTGRFKCLIPPACSLHQCGADWFGRPRVHIIDDRFHRFAESSTRVFLLQTMASD